MIFCLGVTVEERLVGIADTRVVWWQEHMRCAVDELPSKWVEAVFRSLMDQGRGGGGADGGSFGCGYRVHVDGFGLRVQLTLDRHPLRRELFRRLLVA
jgi:hypothetical protein